MPAAELQSEVEIFASFDKNEVQLKIIDAVFY